MIERLRTPALAVAALGFVASVVVHVLGWAHVVPPGSQWVMWGLQAGLLFVWLPAALLAWRVVAGWKTERYLREYHLRPLLRAIPIALRIGVCVLAAYALVVPFLPAHNALWALAYGLRKGSAYWMFGYGAALALLWSVKK